MGFSRIRAGHDHESMCAGEQNRRWNRSYGRSFGMEDPSCVGPECLFTGLNSTATPGQCTVTVGYISQAELEQISSSALPAVIPRSLVGVVEWALDVATFVERENMTDANFNITQAKQAITEAISTSGYNISDFADFNLTILATALTGDDGCTELQQQQIRSDWVESWKIMKYIYNVANAGIGFNEAAAVVTDVGKFN
ncbi:hypothetical protein CNMCM7691_001486 [Aspergillus felis]|uniref:Uncharacterized protein n=1 Tax=Aspergillus felis TaxID=1287682 RepID=A0A8H6V7R8_9EURO|nr:hypothetical protein CNMCM7691_001486 [Aspergillus felis]